MPESQFMKAFKVANFTIVEQAPEGARLPGAVQGLGLTGLEQAPEDAHHPGASPGFKGVI